MEDSEFWSIIEECKKKDYLGDEQSHYKDAHDRLEKLSDLELKEFAAKLLFFENRASHWDVWASAYIINGGCSDDMFMDFRRGLIFQGKKIFEATLADVDSLSELNPEIAESLCEYELFSYLPLKIYESRSGNNPEEFECYLDDYQDNANFEYSNSDPAGEAWGDDSELVERFPKLASKYQFSAS